MSLYTKFVTYMLYKTKYESQTVDVQKLIEVVMSVDTPEQAEVARTYLELHASTRWSADDAFGQVGRMIVGRLNHFLTNSIHHFQYGWHKTNPEDTQVVNKYPDMNDYLGKVMNAKFRPCWIKGKSSIISVN